MRTQSSDTSPEAERVLIELLRAAPPWRRLQLASRLSATARSLSLDGLRLRNPEADDAEIRKLAAKLFFGDEWESRTGLAEALLAKS